MPGYLTLLQQQQQQQGQGGLLGQVAGMPVGPGQPAPMPMPQVGQGQLTTGMRSSPLSSAAGQAQQNTQQAGRQMYGATLPPTGLEQQLSKLKTGYQNIQGLANIGFDPEQWQFQQAQAGQTQLQGQSTQGATSLQAYANNLAKNYGLNVSGNLFDENGVPLMTPEQLANASGGTETLGTASAKMQYIADAISRKQTEEAQQHAQESLQAGVGLVQSRARGSLAAMQSGFYQQMASQYANQEYEAADFNFWIQLEKQRLEEELRRKEIAYRKRKATGQIVTGSLYAIGGIATGNVALAGYGIAQITEGANERQALSAYE